MPNIQSAKKRMRSDAKKQARNQAALSELKSLSKKLSTLTEYSKAESLGKEAIAKYDKAVIGGIIPRGRADRRKSRITLFLNKLRKNADKR